jgi:hypothetical protein
MADRPNGSRAVATLALQRLRSPEQVCGGWGSGVTVLRKRSLPNVRAFSHIASVARSSRRLPGPQ